MFQCFSGLSLYQVLESGRIKMLNEVKELTVGVLRANSDETLTEKYVQEYEVSRPVIDEDNIEFDPVKENTEAAVNVVTVHFPFTGEKGVFRSTAPISSIIVFDADVKPDEIVIRYKIDRE
jgi:hypothetical protein